MKKGELRECWVCEKTFWLKIKKGNRTHKYICEDCERIIIKYLLNTTREERYKIIYRFCKKH